MSEQDHPRSLEVSQLVDGELSLDEANALWGKILDDPELRRLAQGELKLRAAFAPWRAVADKADRRAHGDDLRIDGGAPYGHDPWSGRRSWQRAGTMLLGAAMILVGFAFAHLFHDEPEGPPRGAVASHSPPRTETWVITPERQREVEEVFAMNEQIAGPLAWMADSEDEIRLHESDRSEPPESSVAVMLRVSDVAERPNGEHEVVVVCRSQTPAVFDVPFGSYSIRVCLRAHRNATDDRVALQYALSIPGGDETHDVLAVLTGQQRLDLEAAPLGRFVVNDRLLDLKAGAWVFN